MGVTKRYKPQDGVNMTVGSSRLNNYTDLHPFEETNTLYYMVYKANTETEPTASAQTTVKQLPPISFPTNLSTSLEI